MAFGDWQSVSSDNIDAHRRDPETGVIEIRFKGGKVYSYPDVPEDEYNSFANASSVGSHFHHRIKCRYPGTRS